MASRRLGLVTALVLLLVALAPAVAHAEIWNAEPNNTIDQAFPVYDLRADGDSVTVSGDLSASSDRDDVLAVWLYAGERLRASISGWPGTNFHLYAYGPDTVDFSSPVASAVATGVASQYLEFSAEESGWHYVRGRANAGASECAFGLRLVRTATYTMVWPTASTVSFGGITSIHGRIELADYPTAPYPAEGDALVSLNINGSGFLPYKVVPVSSGYFRVETPWWAQHNATYQATYLGTSAYAPSASASTTVKMKAKLTTVAAKRTTTRTYLLSGKLTPHHKAGTYPVRIYLWRYVNGRYKAYGYKNAKAYTIYDSYGYPLTQYKRLNAFPYAGRWRMQAYHSDSGHAATRTGYSYVTVR